MKKLVLLVFASVFLTLAIVSELPITIAASPGEISVPFDYPTIQKAINAANPGDKIFVFPGTYNEHVVVNKSIILVAVYVIGDPGSIPIIDGNWTGTVVTITASNASIIGFTIENSGLNTWDSGIYVDISSGSNISRCTITDNYYGIRLYGSNSNVLSRNIISSNLIGIGGTVEGCLIKRNILANNSYGITITDGFWLNTIYQNDFIDNNIQVHLVGEASVNTWDNSAEGNYWSDYTERYPNASEIDGTGIWDTPYVITSNDNVDYYPIVPEFPSLLILPLFMIATLLVTSRRLFH